MGVHFYKYILKTITLKIFIAELYTAIYYLMIKESHSLWLNHISVVQLELIFCIYLHKFNLIQWTNFVALFFYLKVFYYLMTKESHIFWLNYISLVQLELIHCILYLFICIYFNKSNENILLVFFLLKVYYYNCNADSFIQFYK